MFVFLAIHLIQYIKNRSSCGYDGIFTKYSKYNNNTLLQTMFHITKKIVKYNVKKETNENN